MLSIRNLSHIYPGGKRALDGVSLEIPAGMFGLLGPNGAGGVGRPGPNRASDRQSGDQRA